VHEFYFRDSLKMGGTILTSKFNENVDNVSECVGLGAYEVKRSGIDVFRITKN
jgi:hypothetical protein